MKFTESIWKNSHSLYQKILAHPFIQSLSKGTLELCQFQFYMKQDAHFLVAFSRALALIAGRANSSKMIEQFLKFSLDSLVAERELHAKFLPSLNDHAQLSPACLAYSQFLLATGAISSLNEAIAAILPCFWIYREVGKYISENSEKNNPYSLWIKTYSSQEFSDGTDQALTLLDEIASQSSPSQKKRMQTAFSYSTLFEWNFWNDAYHMILFEENFCTPHKEKSLEISPKKC